MAVLLLVLKHLCWTSCLAWNGCSQKYHLLVVPRMHGAKQNVAGESSESREVKYWSRLVVLFFGVLDVLSSRESVLFSSPKEGQYLPHRSDIRAVSRVFWSYLRLAQYTSMEIVRSKTQHQCKWLAAVHIDPYYPNLISSLTRICSLTLLMFLKHAEELQLTYRGEQSQKDLLISAKVCRWAK